MADFSTSSGGVHPGKPVIWPTGKPTPTSSSEQSQTQSTQAPATPATSSAAPAAPTTPAAASATAAAGATTTAGTPSRPLTVSDIMSQLSSIQLPTTEANIKLSTEMLRFGIELSRDNFIKAFGLLEGTAKTPEDIQAALLMLSKGINSPEAVKTLSGQLSENPKAANQLSSMNAALAKLSNSLSSNPSSFSPTMMSQLTALISQFSAMIDDLPKKYDFTSENTPSVKRGDLMNDIKGLKSLLDGLQQKAEAQGNKAPQELIAAIKKTGEQARQVLDNLTAQVLLSQKSQDALGKKDYIYYQIPNSMATPPTTVDIAVQRSGGKENPIDLSIGTILAIGLNTELLGEMLISMMVKEKKVEFVVSTVKKETKELYDQQKNLLKENLNKKGFSVEKMAARVVDKAMCSVKPLLIPLLGLEKLFRIDRTV